jgi:aquaporin Z
VAKAPRYIAEFIGTYVLVLTVGCNVLGKTGEVAVLSIAFSLMIMIMALGSVSGGHFNPAVSVALALCKQANFGMKEAVTYSLMQILGGIAAGFTYYIFIFHETFNLQPSHEHNVFAAFGVELLYTTFLVYVVLNCASDRLCSDKGKNHYTALAVGSTVLAGGYTCGHISGGTFNPAVAIGIDIASAHRGIGWCAAYLGIHLLASALAAVLFRVTRSSEFSMPQKMRDEGGESGARDPRRRSDKFVAEVIGTFFLCVTVGLAVAAKAPVIPIAGALLAVVYALGDVSGAHVNPAVTVAIDVAQGGRKADVFQVNLSAMYIGAQLIGALLGFVVATAISGHSFHLQPRNDEATSAALAEFVATTVLGLVVLSTATVARPSFENIGAQIHGLAIGFTIFGLGMAIGPVSGGSLNPAVSIAIDVNHWIWGGAKESGSRAMMYMFAELAGGAAAGALFSTLFAHSQYGKAI